jgi:uncharacterized lipoprotein YddW (UPF0748 family)
MLAEILCLALAAQDPGTPELRGGWLSSDTFDTAAERTSIVAKFRRAHLNTMFVTCPPVGGNYGESAPADFAALIDEAKAAGLAVHAWFQSFKRLGEASPADFASAAEQEAQKRWVLDLLSAYPKLDGIHLDYIRYSTWEDCIAAKMDGLVRTISGIRQALRAQHPGLPLTAAVFRAAAVSYRGWKPTWQGDVPAWYRDWYAADPDNYYVRQAALPGNNANWLLGPSFFSYQQDPPAWLQAGLLDAVLSMQYTAVLETWQNEVLLWKSFLGRLGVPADKACMGLGWMGPSTWWEDSAFDAKAMVAFIKYGRSQGLKGFCLFRLGQPGVDDGPLLDALSVDGPDNGNAAPFKADVASPLSAASAAPPAPSPPGGSAGAYGCGLTGIEGPLLLVLLALRPRAR